MYVGLIRVLERSADCDQCFKFIVNEPPRPLTEEDIWFQIGHVHEQQKDVSYIHIIQTSRSVLTIGLVRVCPGSLSARS